MLNPVADAAKCGRKSDEASNWLDSDNPLGLSQHAGLGPDITKGALAEISQAVLREWVWSAGLTRIDRAGSDVRFHATLGLAYGCFKS